MTAATAVRLENGFIEVRGVRYDEGGDLEPWSAVTYEFVNDKHFVGVKPARKNPKALQLHGFYESREAAEAAGSGIHGWTIIEVQE